MGARGFVRSVGAAIRSAEREGQRQYRAQQRESVRRYKQLQRDQAQSQKLREQERAAREVALAEAFLDVLLSVHRECEDSVDWSSYANAPSPQKPVKPSRPTPSHQREADAKARLDSYRPSLVDKLFRRIAARKDSLRKAVEAAREDDRAAYKRELELLAEEWNSSVESWKEEARSCEEKRELAARVLQGEDQAFLDAILKFNTFSEISMLGSNLDVSISSMRARITVHVHDVDVVPNETKSLTKTGKISVRAMSAGKRMEIYQDHVCACTLRVAREAFALLPLDSCIVTAVVKMLDPSTGHHTEEPVLSVAFSPENLQRINWDAVDPSDAMKNFIHRMKFKRSAGFDVIQPLELDDIRDPQRHS